MIYHRYSWRLNNEDSISSITLCKEHLEKDPLIKDPDWREDTTFPHRIGWDAFNCERNKIRQFASRSVRLMSSLGLDKIFEARFGRKCSRCHKLLAFVQAPAAAEIYGGPPQRHYLNLFRRSYLWSGLQTGHPWLWASWFQRILLFASISPHASDHPTNPSDHVYPKVASYSSNISTLAGCHESPSSRVTPYKPPRYFSCHAHGTPCFHN